ncbi:F-box domain-containing protein [Rhynchospora pubera]|uniref:F-box domain-containing protein n=1 Tax=Rhynchospora pubera TaxID=906938 RepID=A0AAV8C112_9POAL|nr:F-box domain-containing protein [Rhynchospora pubera]
MQLHFQLLMSLKIQPSELNYLVSAMEAKKVCKAWRFSTPITDQPQQFPWILVHGHGELESKFWWYSITSNKIYTIHAPKSFALLFGPSEGYIIAHHNLEIDNSSTYQLSLFNPLSNHEIPLPPIDIDDYGLFCYPWNHQTGEYVFCYHHGKLSFWHLGQNSWCKFNIGSYSISDTMLYYKNMIFILENETGVTKAVDMFTGTLIYVIPPTKDYSTRDFQYMVEALGDIFIVIQRSSGSILSESFDVYRLDANKSGSPYWVKVTSIGDQALFIDCRGALILKANDFASIKSNSIYFFCHNSIDKCDQVKRMDIETGTVKHLQDFFTREVPVWFVPNIYHL